MTNITIKFNKALSSQQIEELILKLKACSKDPAIKVREVEEGVPTLDRYTTTVSASLRELVIIPSQNTIINYDITSDVMQGWERDEHLSLQLKYYAKWQVEQWLKNCPLVIRPGKVTLSEAASLLS